MSADAKPLPSHSARERHWQLRALLTENGVPKPHILWIFGAALPAFLSSIGKEPFFKDERIHRDQLYRFNLETGRYRKVEPRP